MGNLKKRLTVLEGKRTGAGGGRVLPFPPEDGDTPEDIERKLAEWEPREPLSEQEWAEMYGVEDCSGSSR